MKKIFCAIVLPLLLCGCTKQYDSVGDYASEMETVFNANSSYEIEYKSDGFSNKSKGHDYIKGENAKSESVIIREGRELTPMIDMLKNNESIVYAKGDKEAYAGPPPFSSQDIHQLRGYMGTIGSFRLIDWNRKQGIPLKDGTFAGVTSRNGFSCRMITFPERKVCVSDKYGIAVYFEESLRNKVYTVNVNKIKTNHVLDSEFDLPDGVRKVYMNR